jgi:sigma-B regulation protein RsbU (phosphoserine phosphatase)
VVSAVIEYEDAADQTDDITVLAFQYYGAKNSTGLYDSKIVIKNHMSELSTVISEFDEFGKKHNLSDEFSTKFKIIIDELGSNIINYAYNDDDKHEIIFQFELTGSILTASVTDDGMPFNPLDISEPDIKSGLEEREVGGLGIHLVRNLVDDVLYHRETGQNVLTLVKNIERTPILEQNRNNSDESLN